VRRSPARPPSSETTLRVSTVGYARVSTDHKALEAQHDALTAAGCERIFTDKLSGTRDGRPGLSGLLDYTRAGDVVVVVALDWLGRVGDHPHRRGADRGGSAAALAAGGDRILDRDRADARGRLCRRRLPMSGS